MFASKHPRVEKPSKSIPTLRKDLRFRQVLILFMKKCSQRSTTKVGKGLEKVVHAASKTKKKIWTKTFIRSIIFQQLRTIILQKQRSSGDFAFTFPTLFESGSLFGEKNFNTVVSEANCCFILMGDFFEETEMYDTNNRRSLHLSES